ncbi:hypothetical protein F0342_04025 [Bacillus sp. CH30_1T]|uniref:hypothetical protein n=1 Tax=Bacillus sp. CH30_1T TaxID=2604836 RepID=UPI0011EF3C64|nr:hypothetical protein [Bacillus sp. CH30_1T]KAA0565864.1 hypothetical protein F0342_04025 [Bacillus sp. CH30_1T]
MKPLHNGLKGNGSLITMCTFLILSSIYLISTAFTTLPGTYAWFTSETSASGTIQNATTEDLLQIQASEIQYGSNCSIENTLTVKNISDMSTKVTISLQFGSGEELLTSQKLKPGESLNTAPDAITDMTGGCEATSLTYHIQGFINYVDETYSVAVDSNELKETIVPESVESKVEEKPKVEDEANVDDQEKAEPEEEEAESREETPVKVEDEEVEPPVVEDPEPEEKTEDKPQVEEEDVSSSEPPDENVIDEVPQEKQVEEEEEEKSEQANSIAGE